MPLDHKEAVVTISFSGLALSCINKKKNNRYEFGILGCERHNPVFDIQKIYLDPKTMIPISSRLMPHSLSLADDIEIEVVNPGQVGVSKHEKGDFDRLNDKDKYGNEKNDLEDFRWIVDLEGEEFHNKKLEIKDRSKLKPRIFINSGTLYSEKITDEIIALVPVNHKSKIKPLGRVAFKVGLDIKRSNAEESGVILRNKNNPDNFVELRSRLNENPLKKYQITIENLCYESGDGGGTDFLLFYDVIRDPDERKFDLQRIVDNGARGNPGITIPDRNDLSLDTPPLNCFTVFLGQTDTIL
jgi:hypothetical protein